MNRAKCNRLACVLDSLHRYTPVQDFCYRYNTAMQYSMDQ